MQSGEHFPCKSAISVQTIYDGVRNEPASPADVLRPVTYGVVGRHQPCWRPAPCNILPGRDRLVAGEELLPARLIGARSLLFRKQCGIVRLKEIMHGKSYCLSFYTAFNKHKCRKGKYMNSGTSQSLTLKPYTLHESRLRIQRKNPIIAIQAIPDIWYIFINFTLLWFTRLHPIICFSYDPYFRRVKHSL